MSPCVVDSVIIDCNGLQWTVEVLREETANGEVGYPPVFCLVRESLFPDIRAKIKSSVHSTG